MQQSAPSSGNYLIVCEMRSGSLVKFEKALAELGAIVRLNATVWLLHGETTLASVRNRLIPEIGANDLFFVADVGPGRRAWINVGLSLEAQLRSIWKTPETRAPN